MKLEQKEKQQSLCEKADSISLSDPVCKIESRILRVNYPWSLIFSFY
jgi:hypothetical protein